MKSITKKVVALSATFAMAASFAASAASIDSVTVADGATADNITVNYTATGLATDAQATILVYEGETPFADGTGDNVGYINQDTANGSFSFAMRDSLVPETGKKEFKVMIGGTDVALAAKTTFELGDSTTPTTTYSISGTVGDVPNYLSDEELAGIYATTITVQDAEYNVIGEPIVVDVSSIEDFGVGYAPFKIDGLTIGQEYIITFDRVGVCAKDVVLTSSINADQKDVVVDLWATDMDDNYFITADDIDSMVTLLSAGEYSEAADSDLNGFVTADDIDIAVTSLTNFANYTMTIGE